MRRNNTKAVKNIAKMYEQLGLAQDDIFHKTKLLLSIYRDVVWATLSDCNCVNKEIYYYGDDLTDALVYLEDYKNSPNYIVKRLDPFARVKEKCDKCQNLGYDYLVIERSKEGR